MTRIARIMKLSIIVALTLGVWLLSGPFFWPYINASMACEVRSQKTTGQIFHALKGSSQAPNKDKKLWVTQGYGRLPLYFIENRGQVDAQVKFYEKSGGHTIFFTQREIVSIFKRPDHGSKFPSTYRLSAGDTSVRKTGNNVSTINRGSYELIRLRPLGMRQDVDLIAEGPQPCKINYFIGRDPKKWRAGIPTYRSVVYREAYPGIDLRFYGTNRQLEYDVVVKPGSDPSLVKLRYSGLESLKVNKEGDLTLHLKGGGALIQKRPVVYQQIGDKRVRLNARFKVLSPVHGDQGFVYAFEVDSYDKRYALIIDPTLVYSTYLGGGSDDEGIGIAVDSAGSCYVTGLTESADFPSSNPFQGSLRGSSDAFVTKLNSAGDGLVYSTYLGGNGDDGGVGVSVDGLGNCYVIGWTESADFPSSNPFQGSLRGSSDAFVTKLNSAGNGLVYSTYLGGKGDDGGVGISVGGSSNCYVIGWTESVDFPSSNPFQGSLRGSSDAFVTKLNSAGNGLVYSTYLGGNNDDEGIGIAVDSSGNCYVTGYSKSTDFPTKNPYQVALRGNSDAFAAKFNTAGNGLVYSTYLGGSGNEYGIGIAINGSGNCHLTGWTGSTDFPTLNPFQASLKGDFDAIITKLNAAGNGLVYSTYLGGTGYEYGIGITIDAFGNYYVSGWTGSSDFPTLNPFQASLKGYYDAFVTGFNAADGLIYSTYLGGNDADSAESIAVDSAGNCYVTGWTESTDFPTLNPFQGSLKGESDVFVTKFGTSVSPPVANFEASPTTGLAPLVVNFTDLSTGPITQWSWGFGDGSTSTEKNPSHTYINMGTYSVSLTVINPGGTDNITRTDYIDVRSCSYGPVRIGGQYYSTIQAAYDQAYDGDVIQCQALDFPEDLRFDLDVSVTIKGGYDCSYTSNNGYTRIRSFSIQRGTITAEKLILTPSAQVMD